MFSLARRMHLDDPLVRLHPKDNFYQSVSFFPMPFALITTVNDKGTTSIGPHSLVFPLDLIEHPSMLLVSRAGSNTATNLRNGSKCALNYVEFNKEWLKSVVALGYPGQTPEDKMKDTAFSLTKTPSDAYQDDPRFPLLVGEAFQIYECEVDEAFHYHPQRETAEMAAENFFALKVVNVLLKESVKQKLEAGEEFPDMPISYGFRGGNEFWFTRHTRPFHIPVPRELGPKHGEIYYMANKLDPEVRFTEEACKKLVGVPKAFLKIALKGIIKEAKENSVSMVDEAFMEQVNAQRTDS